MNINRFKKFKKFGLVLLVPALISIFSFTLEEDNRYFEITKNIDIFATLFKEVNAYYVDEVNPSKLIRTGIDAMLQSLDPYTNFIPEDDIEDYRTMTTGQYGGIGATIGRTAGKNMIIMPYENYPAYNSGLKIADQLLEVDGIDVTDKTTSEISKLLKGQANTKVNVKIKRYGEEEPITVTITRKKITIDILF